MGNCLNNTDVFSNYSEVYASPYFVDKSEILKEIIPRIGTTEKYICITRPRRFGKSIMANMIASFFSAGCNAGSIFKNLKIAETDFYRENLNLYNVIFISFNELPRKCKNYETYIERIESRLRMCLASFAIT